MDFQQTSHIHSLINNNAKNDTVVSVYASFRFCDIISPQSHVRRVLPV
jgi:hypothetical protein